MTLYAAHAYSAAMLRPLLTQLLLLVSLGACHHPPKPEVVGSTNGQAFVLAMDEGWLYWLRRGNAATGTPVYDGAVMRMPKSGGPPTVLAGGQFLADHLAIDATHVYWSHDRWEPGKAHSLISRVPKHGGAVVDIYDGDRGVESLAVDDTDVFWASGQVRGKILKQAKSGGAPLELAKDQWNPRGLAIDAKNVYWLTYEAHHVGVHQVAKSGGAPLTLSRSLAAYHSPHLGVDASRVYWIGRGASGNDLMQVPIGGGTPSAVPGAAHVTDFAVDAGIIYFTRGDSADLFKLAPGAASAQPIGSEVGTFAGAFVFDGTSVYYTVPGDEQIRRAKR